MPPRRKITPDQSAAPAPEPRITRQRLKLLEQSSSLSSSAASPSSKTHTKGTSTKNPPPSKSTKVSRKKSRPTASSSYRPLTRSQARQRLSEEVSTSPPKQLSSSDDQEEVTPEGSVSFPAHTSPVPTEIVDPIKATRFEDLINDPVTCVTAHQLFQKELQKTRGCNWLESGRRAASKSAVQKTNDSDEGNGLSYGLDLDLQQGINNVQNLIDRYMSNKKIAKRTEKLQKNKNGKIAAYDSSDDEFFLIEDEFSLNDFTGSTDDYDFMKHSVPQYDLKVKLCDAHFNVIKNMEIQEVESFCREIFPELDKIMDGSSHSTRHNLFKTYDLSKHSLRQLTVSEPFSPYQDNHVSSMIQDKLSDRFHDLTENNGELIHYISNVLVPEALIRIFALANKIDLELAEKELRFKAGYDGEFSDEQLEKITGGSEL